MDELGIPDYMQDGVILYVERGIRGGGFLSAVLSNDLIEAFGAADMDNTNAMASWAKLIYNYLPAASWGSPEMVAKWVERGGLKGREE
jgi:hypothetical protein